MFYLCIRLITKHMDEITKIETVDQYDQLFGLETLHPLVNVIDFSKATKSVEYIRMNIGFYCLFLKDAKCGDLTYGRKNYDYQEGTVVCMAPGQVSGIDNRNRTAPRTKSIGVLFHPDLIRGTSLGQNIKNFTFFSYEVNESGSNWSILSTSIASNLSCEISNCYWITVCVSTSGSSLHAIRRIKI